MQTKKAIATFLTDTHLKESNLKVNHTIYQEAIEHTKKLGLKVIYHLGDIFESRTSQTVELLKYGFLDILDNFTKEEIELIAIPGNHDKTLYSDIHSFLTPFQHHPAFTLIETHFTYLINLDEAGQGILLHLLPFFEDNTYNKYLKELYDEQYNVDFINILGTHVGLTGAIMNNGTEVHSDVDNSIIKQYDLCIIGHYHDSMSFNNVLYAGSSIQHNFGEKPNKGLTVLYDDLSTEILPLTFPKYTTYSINVKELKKSDLKDLQVEKEGGDNIRINLEGTQEEVNAYNKQDLLNIGIKVEKKIDKVIKEEVEANVEKYDNSKIKTYFTEFAKKNVLDEAEGLVYLNKI